MSIAEFVADVMAGLEAGKHNATVPPGGTVASCEDVDNAFIDAGWRRVKVKKGDYLTFEDTRWYVFSRMSAGTINTQWGFFSDEDVVKEPKQDRRQTLF